MLGAPSREFGPSCRGEIQQANNVVPRAKAALCIDVPPFSFQTAMCLQRSLLFGVSFLIF